jgi:hypothetical protein
MVRHGGFLFSNRLRFYLAPSIHQVLLMKFLVLGILNISGGDVFCIFRRFLFGLTGYLLHLLSEKTEG